MGRWALYIRRSYESAEAGDVSDETQEAVCRSVIPKGSEVEVITDSGGHKSGYVLECRDGYQVLLAGLKANRFDGVVAYDVNRLRRNALNSLDLKSELD
ncbi:MAG: recombinase family protein [Chloroflexi bacterium]|nr:recombinase family protein [Chloroflexota bacterium]